MVKAKKKILLVEDDAATIEVYKMGLEQAGFDVDPIVTGQEAMRLFEEINEDPKKKPDLVLLDILLPDMNGMDILKRIRELENIKDVKVLILSNYSSKELEKKGVFLKTERYLLKTENKPSDLVKLIKEELK
jgi:DNA-binding response OmpR family regulator